MSLRQQLQRQMDELDAAYGAPRQAANLADHVEALRGAVLAVATELDAIKSEMRGHWPTPPGR